MEETQSLPEVKPTVTKEMVLAKMNIALTKEKLTVSAQRLQNEADALVFNQDNLPVINEYLKKLKTIDGITTVTHKDGKAHALAECNMWDAAKTTNLAITEAVRKPLLVKWNALNAEIDKKDREQKAADQKKKDIESLIENTVIDYSNEIAACVTNEQLLAVERKINLEKSPSRKVIYGEFHEKAITRFDSVLIPIIKDQKEKIKQKEAIDKQILEAENNDDAAKVEQLRGKQEEIDNEILQNQVDVQQNALVQMASYTQVAHEIFPKIKAVDNIKFEISDISVAVKKSFDLMEINLKHRPCQKVAMTLKEAGTFDNKDEVVVNGIRFFIDKSFRL